MDIHESELNQYQHSSSKLVVFSRLAERAVQVAYPTHFDHDWCGFKLNFMDIFRTSLLKSSYGGLPTLESGQAPADMEILLVVFTLQGFPAQEIAPYFEGYLGEHIFNYPAGTRQLSRSLLFRRPKKGAIHIHRVT
ncbi:hypothetical protein K438DRAFT_1973253 [Mycena galopus ATCC 62051]|nr:hypothetical protein K438DRAFT_1973253 [Mycena galopus ATCC 62051]